MTPKRMASSARRAGGAQPRLTLEREQVGAMRPQALGQALVRRIRLGREDQVGLLVLAQDSTDRNHHRTGRGKFLNLQYPSHL
jgi:hypothetical protein